MPETSMRSEQEILKAFEGLDRAPGSKKPRRESTPVADKRRAKAFGESNGWDSEPVLKTIRGEVVEVFTIGAFAKALEKQIVTLRHWEKKGYIPGAPYRLRAKTLGNKKVGGNRIYTRELIEIAIEEFSARGLLGSARIEWNQHDDLTDAITKRWKEAVEATKSK
jgi:hypothetical protein